MMNPKRIELIPIERDTKQKEKKKKKTEGRDWENWEGLKPLYMEKSRSKVPIAHFHGSFVFANAVGFIPSCFFRPFKHNSVFFDRNGMLELKQTHLRRK